MDRGRRRFVLGTLSGGLALGAGAWPLVRPRVWNPCHADLPGELADHTLVRAAWAGVDPHAVWDCHVHLAGIGDGGSGIEINERMMSLLHPLEYLQRLFYLNAGCAHESPGRVDQSYVDRLLNLAEGMAPGAKLLLYAFDRCHDAAGRPLPEASAFHVPDGYAAAVARDHSARFEWACSIHPYRPDCVDALERAVADGARAVKWLPQAMAIDPAAPACDRFYSALARFDLPLISHAGEEKAVHGIGDPGWGNPLRLRRALDHGVRVVVAHCASIGEDQDLDRGENGPRVPSFELFTRLMDDAHYGARLHGDISALVLRNRDLATVRDVIERDDWHPRLLFGTDYPLPGILPLISPAAFAAGGMLEAESVPVLEAIREHNPLLFGFVLKRHLVSNGRRFSPTVFETRRFFDRSLP